MILVVDNYDSFTYNLVQLLWSGGEEVEVVRNDAATAADLVARGAAGILLSPGPGRPEDAGVCLELVGLRPRVPLLGVCLGQQVLGAAFGAIVGRASRLMHGKTSLVRHHGEGLFAGVPSPFEATRYHSLEVREETLPAKLEAVAWSEDGTLMGLRHRELPYWGVQFHPESILTRHGPLLIGNFLAMCAAGGAEPSPPPAEGASSAPGWGRPSPPGGGRGNRG
jgi:anthranilate synthase/aminodeoxychorismate synthase-like glutamine amidotransferase